MSIPRSHVAAAKPATSVAAPAAEADDRVLAAHADTSENLPDEGDDGQILTGFGVRQLDTVRIDTVVRQCFSDRFGGPGHNRLVQDHHLVA